MWKSVFAISIGAAVGALSRWQLGLKLNSIFPSIPPGTLAANLIGGYVVGLAVAYFAHEPSLAPEWRFLIITGFCGGLTTFSTFSAEVVGLIEDNNLTWAMASIAAHVIGSLSMTLAGIASWQVFKTV
jgi:CrcB protein